MYEPRGYVYEVGFFARYSSQRWLTAMAPGQWHVGAPHSPLCAPRAPFWQRWWPIFRPLGSQNRARTPRRLCALRSRSAPAEARTTGSNRLACSRCVPTFSRGGFGTEKKCDFQIGQLLLLRRPLQPTPPGADMLPATSSDAEGFRRRVIAFRKPLDPLLKAHISAFRPVLRFTDLTDISHVVMSEGMGGQFHGETSAAAGGTVHSAGARGYRLCCTYLWLCGGRIGDLRQRLPKSYVSFTRLLA